MQLIERTFNCGKIIDIDRMSIDFLLSMNNHPFYKLISEGRFNLRVTYHSFISRNNGLVEYFEVDFKSRCKKATQIFNSYCRTTEELEGKFKNFSDVQSLIKLLSLI